MIALFSLKAAFFPSQSFEILQAIKVDIVALPEKVTSKNSVTPKKVAPKVSLKKNKSKNKLKNLKFAQKKAMLKLKRLQKEQELKKQQQKALEGLNRLISRSSSPPKKVAGNALSDGNSLSGMSKLKFQRYLGSLSPHILQHWNVPSWLEGNELRVKIFVTIDKNGKVLKKEVESTSGNDLFDGSAIKAVEDASPFPKPPERLASQLEVVGMTFWFPR